MKRIIKKLSFSLLVFKKAKQYLYKSKYVAFSILLLLASVLSITTFLNTDEKVYASFRSSVLESPNQPMGEGKGIFPGRVIWIWNPDATEEDCTNESDDYWWQEDNLSGQKVQTLVEKQLNKGNYTIDWDTENLSCGTYFYRFKAGKLLKTNKLIKDDRLQ